LRRYQLEAAGNYKKAIKRRDGLSGAASEVRHVYSRDRDVIAKWRFSWRAAIVFHLSRTWHVTAAAARAVSRFYLTRELTRLHR
jgi:hypothetical protein